MPKEYFGGSRGSKLRIEMGFYSDALYLMKLGRYLSAAELLEGHLEDEDLKRSSKSNLLAVLGDCYLKLGDRREAGRLFELAGKTALECNDLPENEKDELASREFDEAMSCYEREDDLDGMGRLAALKCELDSRKGGSIRDGVVH